MRNLFIKCKDRLPRAFFAMLAREDVPELPQQQRAHKPAAGIDDDEAAPGAVQSHQAGQDEQLQRGRGRSIRCTRCGGRSFTLVAL